MKYLTADIGSTYTKLTAIDTDKRVIVGTASAFTTIETNVIRGFDTALKQLESQTGEFGYDRLLCCSSAAGGLKMVALGLVPELTSKAARMAASSAGAKVIKTYSFEINREELDEIGEIDPDLVLLCGGTDGGNKEVIIANARLLGKIDRPFSIIAAGNKSASGELDEILKESGKDYVITHNVMPAFNKLDIEPARQSIKELFIKKIVEAKGLSEIRRMADEEIIPTPLAVMYGCELLSKGTKLTPGIGELIAVDLGGATTDVYSVASGRPSAENMIEKGLPEPYSKRSVEGDLGMRYSLRSLLEETDTDALEQLTGIKPERIYSWVEKCTANPDTIAHPGSTEALIEESLARSAVEIAVERHCGVVESSYSPMGEIFSITGKDLTEVPCVIGIGGAIINSSHPAGILEGAEFRDRKPYSMKPKRSVYMADNKYIFASMGLLSTVEPELALELLKKEITPIYKHKS